MSDRDRRRLNSWKEVSVYLDRDKRTVARWEKDRGLPIRRVPGASGQVFAFTDEIDAWLIAAGDPEPPRVAAPTAADPPSNAAPLVAAPRLYRWRGIAAASAGLVLVAALGTSGLWSSPAPIVAVEIHGAQLVAHGASGAELWRHSFSAPMYWPIVDPHFLLPDLDGDGSRDVVAVLGTSPQAAINREALYAFDRHGRLKWERQVQDVVRFRDRAYAPPWTSGPIGLLGTGSQSRIMWVTHHHTWWPSVVALFDPAGSVVGRFVHAGWITSAAGMPDGVALLSGVANADDADVIAVLDAQSWPGAGPPSSSGNEYECLDCPEGRPVRYYLLPRSELNLRPDKLRPPAIIHAYEAGVEVRMRQSDEVNPAEIIYELTTDYRIRRVRRSDSYWTWHRRLEATGAIKHTVDACPDREGITVREWERGRGWIELRIGLR